MHASSPHRFMEQETWSLSATHAKQLAGFDNPAQRRILGIRWLEFVTNELVQRRSVRAQLQRVLVHRRPDLEPVTSQLP